MEMIVADQIIMGLILDAGDAKQHIYQALSLAKDGKFSECDEQIELADKALLEAHNLQTKFLAQEAGGTKTEITALFVHSQDHLMTSITEINLIKEIIDLRITREKINHQEDEKMVKIGLFCAAGFSTGMLVNNMKIAAAEKGLEAEIEAYSQAKLADYAADLDVALLGPQVAYTLDKSTAICDSCHTPIAVIPMADYGMLDGKKVLNLALSLLDKH